MRKTMSGLRYFVIVVMVLGGLFMRINSARAEETGKDKPQPLELDGTKWDIELTYTLPNGKKKTSMDILIFEDHTITSENYKRKKYDPTNYSLMVETDGTTSFGTMQINEGERSFWNGEVFEDQRMRGRLNVQDPKGKRKEYSFLGKLLSGTLRRKDEQPPEPPPPSPAPEAAPVQESVPTSPAGETAQ